MRLEILIHELNKLNNCTFEFIAPKTISIYGKDPKDAVYPYGYFYNGGKIWYSLTYDIYGAKEIAQVLSNSLN